MASSVRLRENGPKIPIEKATTSMDGPMNVKTPATPKSCRKKPIITLVKIALKRLPVHNQPERILLKA
jgi:hypothetical protein